MLPLALGYACPPPMIRESWFGETWFRLHSAAREQGFVLTAVCFDGGLQYDGLGQLIGLVKLRGVAAVVVPGSFEMTTRREVLEELAQLMAVELIVSKAT